MTNNLTIDEQLNFLKLENEKIMNKLKSKSSEMSSRTKPKEKSVNKNPCKIHDDNTTDGTEKYFSFKEEKEKIKNANNFKNSDSNNEHNTHELKNKEKNSIISQNAQLNPQMIKKDQQRSSLINTDDFSSSQQSKNPYQSPGSDRKILKKLQNQNDIHLINNISNEQIRNSYFDNNKLNQNDSQKLQNIKPINECSRLLKPTRQFINKANDKNQIVQNPKIEFKNKNNPSTIKCDEVTFDQLKNNLTSSGKKKKLSDRDSKEAYKMMINEFKVSQSEGKDSKALFKKYMNAFKPKQQLNFNNDQNTLQNSNSNEIINHEENIIKNVQKSFGNHLSNSNDVLQTNTLDNNLSSNKKIHQDFILDNCNSPTTSSPKVKSEKPDFNSLSPMLKYEKSILNNLNLTESIQNSEERQILNNLFANKQPSITSLNLNRELLNEQIANLKDNIDQLNDPSSTNTGSSNNRERKYSLDSHDYNEPGSSIRESKQQKILRLNKQIYDLQTQNQDLTKEIEKQASILKFQMEKNEPKDRKMQTSPNKSNVFSNNLDDIDISGDLSDIDLEKESSFQTYEKKSDNHFRQIPLSQSTSINEKDVIVEEVINSKIKKDSNIFHKNASTSKIIHDHNYSSSSKKFSFSKEQYLSSGNMTGGSDDNANSVKSTRRFRRSEDEHDSQYYPQDLKQNLYPSQLNQKDLQNDKSNDINDKNSKKISVDTINEFPQDNLDVCMNQVLNEISINDNQNTSHTDIDQIDQDYKQTRSKSIPKLNLKMIKDKNLSANSSQKYIPNQDHNKSFESNSFHNPSSQTQKNKYVNKGNQQKAKNNHKLETNSQSSPSSKHFIKFPVKTNTNVIQADTHLNQTKIQNIKRREKKLINGLQKSEKKLVKEKLSKRQSEHESSRSNPSGKKEMELDSDRNDNQSPVKRSMISQLKENIGSNQKNANNHNSSHELSNIQSINSDRRRNKTIDNFQRNLKKVWENYEVEQENLSQLKNLENNVNLSQSFDNESTDII